MRQAGARAGAGSRRQPWAGAGSGTAGRERRAGSWVAGARAAGRGARRVGRGRKRQARGLATGYALGALGLFLARFESVFFLSQFLDVVSEPGS